jgi:hypothetical protein
MPPLPIFHREQFFISARGDSRDIGGVIVVAFGEIYPRGGASTFF